MSNATVETLDHVTPDDVSQWSIDVLAQIDAEMADQEARIKARREVFKRGVVARYGANTIGTMSARDGAYSIKVETPKRVDWDQAKLSALYQEIGDTAGEYMSVSYGVAESKYKAWPETIRKEFDPARTVRPGAPKVTITFVEEDFA